MNKQRLNRISEHLLPALLIILGLVEQAFAVGSCSSGSGATIIGTEFVARSCSSAGATDNTLYDYLATDIQCTGGTVVKSSSTTYSYDDLSPATITSYFKNYGTFKILRNQDGTHFIIVSRYYTGTLEGVSMNLTFPAVYYNKIGRTYFPPSQTPDGDGDGFTICDDCAANNPNVFPGAPEICNDGVANDCSNSQSADCDNPACAENEACLAAAGDIPPEKHPRDCRLNVAY